MSLLLVLSAIRQFGILTVVYLTYLQLTKSPINLEDPILQCLL